mgnify:CR=1 FL=1
MFVYKTTPLTRSIMLDGKNSTELRQRYLTTRLAMYVPYKRTMRTYHAYGSIVHISLLLYPTKVELGFVMTINGKTVEYTVTAHAKHYDKFRRAVYESTPFYKDATQYFANILMFLSEHDVQHQLGGGYGSKF